MPDIKIFKSGILYRNPIPHVRSLHAFFASPVQMPDGTMLATMSIGQAFESEDLHVYFSRSADEGETWHFAGPIFKKPEKHRSYFCRTTVIDGEVVVYIAGYDRSRKDEGLYNPKTGGFTEAELMLVRSPDGGRTWDGPHIFEAPIGRQGVELCCPVVPLSDGRWLIPGSNWRNWDGFCPDNLRMYAFISYDRGKTWKEYVDVMSGQKDNILYWESKILELHDKRLLAVAWAYNEKEVRDLPNHYAISEDGGKTFGTPMSTGLNGQTLTPLLLDDNQILSVYRRMDKTGLWANISRLEGNKWINESEMPIWGSAELTGKDVSGGQLVKDFSKLRFGAPHMIRVNSGLIYVTFWAIEECVGTIRWIKLDIKP